MKKMVFFICLVFMLVTHGLAENKNVATPKRLGFVYFSFPFFQIQPYQGGSVFGFGAGFSGGVYVSKHSFVSFEIGFTGSSGDTVMQFSYYLENTTTGTKTYHDDGVRTRNCNSIPVLFSWSYEVDFAKRFHFLVGPTLGFTRFKSVQKDSPVVDGAPAVPAPSKKVSFNYGANIGFSCDLAKIMAIQLSYKFLGSTANYINPYSLKHTSHIVNLSFGVRFAK